jgi:hypothetical protein
LPLLGVAEITASTKKVLAYKCQRACARLLGRFPPCTAALAVLALNFARIGSAGRHFIS